MSKELQLKEPEWAERKKRHALASKARKVLDEILAANPELTGSITLHFQQGVPAKSELRQFEQVER